MKAINVVRFAYDIGKRKPISANQKAGANI
jgi:hypothetical protein